MIALVSDNPDKRRYKTFELSEDEIFNVWVVELAISDSLQAPERDAIDELRDQVGDLRDVVDTLVQRLQ